MKKIEEYLKIHDAGLTQIITSIIMQVLEGNFNQQQKQQVIQEMASGQAFSKFQFIITPVTQLKATVATLQQLQCQQSHPVRA